MSMDDKHHGKQGRPADTFFRETAGRERAVQVVHGERGALDLAFDQMSPEALRHAVHELHVHQVELEMQNEELRAAQQQLEAAHDNYLDLYRYAPISYFTVSEQGLIEQTNMALTTLLGVPQRTLLKRSISSIIFDKADHSKYSALRRQVLDTGQPHSCELRVARADGSSLWVNLTASVTQGLGGARAMRVVLDDIDSIKRTQLTLAESESRWKFAIEGAGDGLWDWNVAAGTMFVSARWQQIFGFSQDDVATTSAGWELRIHAEDRAQAVAAVQAHFAGATALFQLEHRMLCKDRSWKWVLGRGLVVERDAAGAPLRMIGTHADIDERKQSEQVLRQLHERLRELSMHQESIKEQERRRIACEIHDELGQNLLALRIDVSMLHARTALSHPRLHGKVTVVLNYVDRTIMSVRAIMNNLRPSVLDLGILPAIEWLVSEFRLQNGIACVLSMDESGIRNDEVRDMTLFRIVQESLANIVRHAQATRVEIDMRRSGEHIVLKVNDNGVGISAVHERRSDAFGILGIKERIEMLGGELDIDSRPGRGLGLTISVPADNLHVERRRGSDIEPKVWEQFFRLFGFRNSV